MPGGVLLYPGSFDPITNGHLDLLVRGLNLFDRVIMSVAANPGKNPLFSLEERMELLRETALHISDRVEVDSFEGLLVDYFRQKKATAVLRGLRAVSDFEFEFEMALTNRRLCEEVDTIFLTPAEEFFFLRSSTVKEVAKLGGDVSSFVPSVVEKRLKEKYQTK
jgi:pantetheine-phosphate adenylyltransferase